eukprot:6206318-Pleurochrysis_carterae.AAC.3
MTRGLRDIIPSAFLVPKYDYTRVVSQSTETMESGRIRMDHCQGWAINISASRFTGPLELLCSSRVTRAASLTLHRGWRPQGLIVIGHKSQTYLAVALMGGSNQYRILMYLGDVHTTDKTRENDGGGAKQPLSLLPAALHRR